jgi:hypothetical protein
MIQRLINLVCGPQPTNPVVAAITVEDVRIIREAWVNMERYTQHLMLRGAVAQSRSVRANADALRRVLDAKGGDR